jgi:transposase-like zinc-binding protein
MITLGEIFRQYGPASRAQCGDQLLPSQHAALQAIEQCRTEALGGQVYGCPACGTNRYSYHAGDDLSKLWATDATQAGAAAAQSRATQRHRAAAVAKVGQYRYCKVWRLLGMPGSACSGAILMTRLGDD